MHPLKKILWAIDPFSEDKTLHKKMAAAIKALTKDTTVSIEPVYVISPGSLSLTPDIFHGASNDLKANAEKALEKVLKSVTIPGLTKATLILSPDYSLRMATKSLVDYGKKVSADLIACSTLGRAGVSRFLLGSYAETLVSTSDIPVYLVSPKVQAGTAFKEILFPTDLTPKSQETYAHVLNLAAEKKLKLTLFHSIEYLTPYTMDVFGAAGTFTMTLEDDTKKRKAAVETMKQAAISRGIKTEVVFSEKDRDVPKAVLKIAKKMKSGLIAMASQTGPVASALLGSVTRGVIRNATSPVWILHPKG